MSNFGFLKDKKEYALFASAAIEAEKVYVSAPAMCAVGSRKALELAVKWVYSADKTTQMPYKDKKAYNISLTNTPAVQRLPQPFNDYNDAGSRNPYKTHEAPPQN